MIDFSDLATDFDNEVALPQKPQLKYPCHLCNGTGKFKGIRVHQDKSECFPCQGKGYFLTSLEHRKKARAKAQAKKATEHKAKSDALQVKRDAWVAQHAALTTFIGEATKWSEFAASLLDSILTKGVLSEGQLNAATSMMDKVKAKEQEKAAAQQEKHQSAPVIELTKINEMFDTVLNKGLKKPILRIGNIKISIAPAHGTNAGHLYVQDGSEYAGKITPAGKYLATKSAPEGINEILVTLAADPLGTAIAHGKATGKCACCGRELTDPKSIELGIGPVCIQNWGL